MQLDYETDVLPHLVEGDNVATRDAINANRRHLRDAPIKDLRRLMLDSGMVTWGGFSGIGGILASLYASSLTDDQKAIADQFLTELVQDAPYPSSTHDGGLRIQQIIGVAQSQEASLRGGYTAASFLAAMTSITGGRKYGSNTTQEVADAIAAHDAQVIADSLLVRVDEGYHRAREAVNAGETDWNAIVTEFGNEAS